jgi:Tfp pilus assembly protein PilV
MTRSHRRHRADGRADGRAAARAGSTLIEVLVTVMLMTTALLALAGLAVTGLRMTHRGTGQTRAAAIAQSRFDSLASVPCDRIKAVAGTGAASGTFTSRGVTERWSARMVMNDNMVEVVDTLRVSGRSTPAVYLSMRACR